MGIMQVPDTQQAERFYGQALGLTADPGSTAAQRGGVGVTWYNIGKQQVRFPHLSCPQTFALLLRQEIGLMRACLSNALVRDTA